MLHEDDRRVRETGLSSDLVDSPNGRIAIERCAIAFAEALLHIDDQNGGFYVGHFLSA